jgi:hypothetical protein
VINKEFKYPLRMKAKISGQVIEFDGLCSGTVIKQGSYKENDPVGHYSTDWAEHTRGNMWESYEENEEWPKDDGKPEQYQIGIDTFERMRANATFEEAMGFIKYSIDKYNTRKKGQDLSDYQKIKDYCDQAIWWIENRGEKI